MNKKSIRTFLLTTGIAISLSVSMPAEAHAETYSVASGDSLYKISKLFGTTVANLMVSNNLAGYELYIGQHLDILNAKHTVQKGDTLYSISQKYDISLIDLRKANNIYSNYIYSGQVLEIPLQQAEQTQYETASENEDSYTAEELDLLARLIMAETESQPYEAKVAVGAVVMNRINSGLFAPTISEVINQKINGYYQFSPVANGWISRAANEECFKAAKEALSGVDNTNGALFYYDTSTTNQWILSKPVSVTYGDMVFAY
ncbi:MULTISPECIES: LysM peptidoglycan-binding domain-containing protein [unclassified Sedimentibacter]|uniref:LysM peptidoglycan-binding domain-containing protein n=1 Tax=unclassified Sedimentibacter TaxID=2649220 RepID=UPI0027E04F5B|nr:LysM peptidoglycan-binding domain-containing protein [Sedimentibacter sp. MB35-C1]WMJ76332.1 LysM peptidoglycan-binding domain-containing protein [Sedimentibacter sp. MB35-C1]